jgi:CDP-glycerol glycerophosphotransferase (TagB/SpsB family)
MILREIINALKELSDVQLVIKPHPAEDGKMHRRIVKEMNANAVITKDIDLYGLLSVSDVLLTESSTTATEAMIFGKAVIIINLDNKPELVPYVKSGAAIGVYKSEDIVSMIKNVLYNTEGSVKQLEEKRKIFVYEHAYMVDGKATERVVSLIEKMINEQRVG